MLFAPPGVTRSLVPAMGWTPREEPPHLSPE